jgi:hypothetical protein
MNAENIVATSKKEKEVYLLFCGWTIEKQSKDNDTEWWFPPLNSPILKKFTATRKLDHAYEWQKNVDESH